MKKTVLRLKAQTIIILILTMGILFHCDLLKKKEETIDTSNVSLSEMNQKIKQLLNDAAKSTDDNNKAKLLGAASNLLMKKGDVKQAVDVARQSLAANPTQKLSLCVLAEYSISHGQIKDAIVYLEDAKRSDEKFARAYYLTGNAYKKILGRLRKIIRKQYLSILKKPLSIQILPLYIFPKNKMQKR